MDRQDTPVGTTVRMTEGVRRRAVLRAGAWAVPAVTVVAAAPAHATSSPGTAPPQLVLRNYYGENWSIYASLVLAAPLGVGASLVVTDSERKWRLSGVEAPTGWTGRWPDNDDNYLYVFTSAVSSGAGRLEFTVGRSTTGNIPQNLPGVSATLFDEHGGPLVTSGPPLLVMPS